MLNAVSLSPEAWQAIVLTIELAGLTTVLLLLLATPLAWWLAHTASRWRAPLSALVTLPLVLPPTVLGFYLLTAFGAGTWLGGAFQAVFGKSLAFSFEGLLLASAIANIPFAVQPIHNAFAAIPPNLREAGATSGMTPWTVFRRIELPLAWPGIATAIVLTFAHTLGEFGVVLMVGGAIPGETRTAAIAIYDRVQAFDDVAAASMSALLLAICLVALLLVQRLTRGIGRRRHG